MLDSDFVQQRTVSEESISAGLVTSWRGGPLVTNQGQSTNAHPARFQRGEQISVLKR